MRTSPRIEHRQAELEAFLAEWFGDSEPAAPERPARPAPVGPPRPGYDRSLTDDEILAKAPEAGDSGATSITLCPHPAGSATRTILQDRWTWEAWILPARARARQEWLKREVTPTWDPQERKMASDLGVLVGRAAVIRQQ